MFVTQKSRRPGREEEEYKALLRKNPLKRIRETKKSRATGILLLG